MRFLEKHQLAAAFIPVDMNTAANTGDWVNMANYEYAVFVLFKGVGTAGDDPVITIEQATAAAGTNNKALDFTVVHEKVGTLTSVGTFTRVVQAAGNTYSNAASAEAAAIVAIEIKADMLDVNGGFTFVQASVADVSAGANPQLGSGLWILCESRYAQATMPTAIA